MCIYKSRSRTKFVTFFCFLKLNLLHISYHRQENPKTNEIKRLVITPPKFSFSNSCLVVSIDQLYASALRIRKIKVFC